MVQNGTLLFTDDATVQCVAVNSPDGMSCFSLRLSTDSAVTGLTLSPALATLCVVSTDEGRLLHLKVCVYKNYTGSVNMVIVGNVQCQCPL